MKKLLVVVDYQNDFVNGSLGFEKATQIEKNICAKIMDYRREKQDVLFTYDTHGDDYLDTQEGKYLPFKHCVKGTPGWELYGGVSRLRHSGDKTLNKPSFGSLGIVPILQEGRYDEIEFCGVVTNICVISNAVIAKAALPEAKIVVDAAAVASNDETLGDKALDVMTGLQIEIINR